MGGKVAGKLRARKEERERGKERKRQRRGWGGSDQSFHSSGPDFTSGKWASKIS